MPTPALAPCAQAHARVRWLRPATAAALHLAALLCLLMLLTGGVHAQTGAPPPSGGTVSEQDTPPADGIVLALSGQVSLLRAGQTSALTVAASVRQGDLIRTGANGRVQLRFSDAGLVSLQPDTEFRIEAYAFGAQGQRGFFELLRGALRAASGAIGKRNHEDYRIKTPTATIGIRGTVFTLVETVCEPSCPPGTRAGLLAHVTEGRIVVRNSAGALELPTGQAARAGSATSAPVITPERPALTPQSLAPAKPADSATARSNPSPDKAPVTASETTPAAVRAVPDAAPRLDAMTAAASVGAEVGSPVAVGSVAVPSVAVSNVAVGTTAVSTSAVVTTAVSTSAVGSSAGNTTAGSATALARPAVVTLATPPAAGSTGGLNLNNKALSSLSSGASTVATSSVTTTTVAAIDPPAAAVTASAAMASPVVAATAAPAVSVSAAPLSIPVASVSTPVSLLPTTLPGGSSMSVSLGTLSIASSPLGSATAGNAIADQAASLSVQTSLPASGAGTGLQPASTATTAPVVAVATMSSAPAATAPAVTPPAATPVPATTPPVTTPTVTIPTVIAPATSTPAVSAPAPITTPAVTAPAGSAAITPAAPSASTPAAAPVNPVVTPPAAITVPPVAAVTPAIASEPVAIAALNGQWRLEMRNMPAQMSYSNAISAGEVVLDAQNRLREIGPCPAVACLSAGTTRVAEAGSDAMVSWGRWTEGSTQLSFLGVNVATPYSANQGMHYLVGTPVVSLPTSGTFRYELLGATRPTAQDGSLTPGTFTGQAVVQFASGQNTRVGLSAQVGIGAAQYSLQTNGGLSNVTSSQLRVGSDYGISGEIALSGSACGGGRCLAQVSGGLFGPGGERLGVSYSISPGANSTRIEGVAVFKR